MYMSWSYRKRGKLPRAQIKVKASIKPIIEDKRNGPEKEISEIIIDMKRIERYSDKNKTTKPGPENSTLKPDTSSDSPSAKSNGERLVSASRVTKSTKERGVRQKKP